jgi:hypothetical protein
MTDAVALGRRRPGGQPKSKDQKRIAMSLRLSPALHARLVARAKEHGRSITQQAEMLLDQALRDPGGIHVLHDEIIKALAEMRERIDQQRAELIKQRDEMRESIDQQRAELIKQRDEMQAEQRNFLREIDEREAAARRAGLFRELDEREARAFAQELKRKRKP